MSKELDKLNPCLSCGGKATLESSSEDCHFVICQRCYDRYGTIHSYHKTKESAIEAWNNISLFGNGPGAEYAKNFSENFYNDIRNCRKKIEEIEKTYKDGKAIDFEEIKTLIIDLQKKFFVAGAVA